MNMRVVLIIAFCVLQGMCRAQTEQHYTLFMYNKLAYNPGYAGSRDATSVNGVYRKQWTGVDGAPQTANIAVDAPLGGFYKPVRKIALGFSLNNEQVGIESSTNVRGYYAYRLYLPMSVLSFGVSGGVNAYSARYTQLEIYHPNDPNFASDIKNAMLPNAGAGVYWSGKEFYCGLSVPNLIENTYDRNAPQINAVKAKQMRAYYLAGGYTYRVNEAISVLPQMLARYSANALYKLPLNCDLNITAIAYERVMVGVTYRTDQSLECILHVQATRHINVGYAYDYLMSDYAGYAGGTHELVLGYDFVRDGKKYATPRFLKNF